MAKDNQEDSIRQLNAEGTKKGGYSGQRVRQGALCFPLRSGDTHLKRMFGTGVLNAILRDPSSDHLIMREGALLKASTALCGALMELKTADGIKGDQAINQFQC